jgi:ribosomal protein S18 acetylase RimI-like enzyme
VSIEIARASRERLPVLASVLGRAFVTEPMMRWPLGASETDDARLIEAFTYFLDALIELGVVWEAGDGLGAAIWVPPDRLDAWSDAQRRDARVYGVTEDGGRRWDLFWEWVEEKIPEEPLWHLDSVAVAPELQGRGIGSALIEFALNDARAARQGAFLETGTARNVPLYERFGFRVIEDEEAPGGGPRIWFMEWNPEPNP